MTIRLRGFCRTSRTLPFGVDRAVIRHGPDRDAAFDGFTAIRDAYRSHHDLWLSRDSERRAPPTLSLQARDRFDRAARVRHVPVQRHRFENVRAELAAARPAALHILPGMNPGTIRLIADIQVEDLASFWSQERGRRLALNSLVAPAGLGPFRHALARLAIHAANVELSANAPDWSPFLTRLTEESVHASSLSSPFVGAMQPATAGPSQELLLSSAADALHYALDKWTFHDLDRRVRDFLVRGTDPHRWIGCLIQPALRARMDAGWTDWRQQLAPDAALRRRFLVLTVSADDPLDGDISEALTLVGPMRMRAIFRCAVLALAVATSWRGLTLKPDFPGNLSYARRSGHACGADLIGGRSLLLNADAHAWSTNFVLLSEATAPIEVGRRSEASLLELGGGDPSLRRAAATTSLIIPADAALLRTLEFGADAMETHLRGIQEAQRAEWDAQLDLEGGGL